MHRNNRILLSAAAFAMLLVAAYFLARRGFYGWSLFVILPLIAGALGAWSFQPLTLGRAIGVGAIIGACGCSLFLLLGLEGFICVLVAIPILVPLTIIGAVLVYWGRTHSHPKRPAVLGLLVPFTLFFDVTAKPPVYAVTTSMVMNAPPERVWKYVVAFPEIPVQPDWMLRTGVAYPIRTEHQANRIKACSLPLHRKCEQIKNQRLFAVEWHSS
jgi:hypothetical protein